MTKIETLVLKYFHGLCSERELVQLRQAILVDPEVLHLLVRTAEEEVMLRELCSAEVTEGDIEEGVNRIINSMQFLWRREVLTTAGILLIVAFGYLLTEQLRRSTIVELFTGTNERGVVRYEHETTTNIWGMTSIARKMNEGNVWRRVEKINSNGKKLGFIEYLQLGRMPQPRLLPFNRRIFVDTIMKHVYSLYGQLMEE